MEDITAILTHAKPLRIVYLVIDLAKYRDLIPRASTWTTVLTYKQLCCIVKTIMGCLRLVSQVQSCSKLASKQEPANEQRWTLVIKIPWLILKIASTKKTRMILMWSSQCSVAVLWGYRATRLSDKRLLPIKHVPDATVAWQIDAVLCMYKTRADNSLSRHRLPLSSSSLIWN